MFSPSKERLNKKMRDFTVMTDSNNDIDPSYAQSEHVVILPQYYHFNDGIVYGDEQKLEPHVFYERLKNGERAYSTGCNPDRVRQLFEAELDQGRDILSIIFSSKCSGSYSTVCKVAEELMAERDCKIYVIDSLSGSVAAGLMVMLAQRMKKEGHTIDEVRDTIEARKADFDIYFLVDHLDYLVRGGRLSAVSGAVGTVLSVKPILHFDDGEIVALKRCRGKNNGRHDIIEALKGMNLDKSLLAVVYSENRDAAVSFKAELENELHTSIDYMAELNLTVGTHTGPDAVGVAFCTLPEGKQ